MAFFHSSLDKYEISYACLLKFGRKYDNRNEKRPWKIIWSLIKKVTFLLVYSDMHGFSNF